MPTNWLLGTGCGVWHGGAWVSDSAGGGGGPPGEEVISELTVCAHTLPRDPHKPTNSLSAPTPSLATHTSPTGCWPEHSSPPSTSASLTGTSRGRNASPKSLKRWIRQVPREIGGRNRQFRQWNKVSWKREGKSKQILKVGFYRAIGKM